MLIKLEMLAQEVEGALRVGGGGDGGQENAYGEGAAAQQPAVPLSEVDVGALHEAQQAAEHAGMVKMLLQAILA
jgi:hypothetical protein